MRILKDIKEILEEELMQIKNKGISSPAQLEGIHKAVETIKYIDEICAINDDSDFNDEYSGRYGRNYARTGRQNYGRFNSGNSYGGRMSGCYEYPVMDNGRGGGMFDQPMGRYSSYGRYSREGATSEMVERLHEMMEQTGDEREREAIKSCIDKLSW